MRTRVDFIRSTFDKAWSRGDTTFLEDEIDEVVVHYGGQQRQMTGQDLRAVIEAWRRGFPDLTFTIEDLVEQGERIGGRRLETGAATRPPVTSAQLGNRTGTSARSEEPVSRRSRCLRASAGDAAEPGARAGLCAPTIRVAGVRGDAERVARRGCGVRRS